MFNRALPKKRKFVRVLISWVLGITTFVGYSSITELQAQAVLTAPAAVCSGANCTVTFTYSIADYYSWTKPSGVSTVTYDVYGSQGGGSSSGTGGREKGTLNLTGISTIYIFVGSQSGFNGGGAPSTGLTPNSGQYGGGASDIRIAGTSLSNRVVVARGGGGAGAGCANGGLGGGSTGGTSPCTTRGTAATGGTQSAGGTGAPGNNGTCPTNGCGANGSLGQGGAAGDCGGAGGGGGGYYGGGGGATDKPGWCDNDDGSGGGGSSYINATYATAITSTQGGQTGNGTVSITYPNGPTISSLTTNSSSWTNASTTTWTLVFAAAITTGTPALTNTGTATGCSFSITTNSNPTYVFTASSCSEGTVIPKIAASSVSDASGAGPAADYITTTPITIDRTAPTIVVETATANGSYGPGAVMNFQVRFNESVTVTGSPYLALTIGTLSKQATYQSMIDSRTVQFRYTVETNTALFDADGIVQTAAISKNGGTITDLAANELASYTISSVPSLTSVLVGQAPTAPTITSVTSNGTQFTVVFTAPATLYGSTITNYQFTTDTGTSWANRTDAQTTSTSMIISKLSSNTSTSISASTTYGIKVRAVATIGVTTVYGESSTVVLANNSALTLTSALTTAFSTPFGSPKVDTITVTGGNSPRSLSITSMPAGMTFDTSTANIGYIRMSSTVTGGVYVETITASDATGASTSLTVTITVVSPLTFSISNANSITTTFGKYASSQISVTNGTLSGRTMTITQYGLQPSGKITLDTSTVSASGYATIKVDTYTVAGTYYETITANDSGGVPVSFLFGIQVNPLPLVSYPTGTNDIVTTNLSVRYEMDSTTSYAGTGTTIYDLSGNGNNGTITGSPTYESSTTADLAFTGTHYIFTNGMTALGSSPYSKFVWVYPTNANFTVLGSFDSAAMNAGYHTTEIEYVGQYFKFRAYNGTTITCTNTQALNAWQFVGIVYDTATGTTTGYVNGIPCNTAVSNTGRSAPATEYVGIGTGDNTNLGVGANVNGQFKFGAFYMYRGALSATDVLFNYNRTKGRFASSQVALTQTSGRVSFTTTAGINSQFSMFSASKGSGNKSFTMAPVTAGITLDTSTVNTAILKVDTSVASTNSTTAATYYETLTATDSVSATTIYNVTLTVNPAVVETATTNTLNTTYGLTSYDTITATQGTGVKTFSMVSSTYSSAITLTTLSSSQALLTVGPGAAIGTYYETITATDSLNATGVTVVKIVVNAAPTITSAGTNTINTTVSRGATLRFNIAGGTDTRTVTMAAASTATSSLITLDTTTITSGYVTLKVDSATPVNIFTETLTVRDNLGSTDRVLVTIVVNQFPSLGDPGIVTSGLLMNLDAGNSSSYFGTGSTWTTTNDSTAYTLNASPTYSSDSKGYLNFNPSALNQYASSSSGLPSAANFTVAAWVKVSATAPAGMNAIISEKYVSKVNYSLFYGQDTGCGNDARGIHLATYNGTWYCTNAYALPLLNTWYYVAGTYDGASLKIYVNGELVVTSTVNIVASGNGISGSSIYIGHRHDGTDVFHGSIATASIYNRALSIPEIKQNYYSVGTRFAALNSNPDTYTITAGVAGQTPNYSVTNGTGSATISSSPDRSSVGITLGSVSSPTYLALSTSDTSTSSPYLETLTATDAAGAVTNKLVTLVVNQPVLETATATTLNTTSGIAASTTIYATRGTGDKIFTYTSSASDAAITANTSVANQLTFNVGTGVNPGTYVETVTATDTVGGTATIVITINVAQGPTITGSRNLATTRGFSYTSPVYAASNGTGILTLTLVSNPTNAGITFDTATLNSAYIKVSSGVTNGTYYETVTVTDSKGAFYNYPVTLRVNAPVSLTGSPTITKIYNDPASTGLTSSGGTGPFTIAGQSICATYETTTAGNTVKQMIGGSSCNWVVPNGVTSIQVLAVGAGGGAGGGGYNSTATGTYGGGGGGGGAGAISTGTITTSAGTSFTVTVGARGTSGTGGFSSGGWNGVTGGAGGTSTFSTVSANGGGGGYGAGNTTSAAECSTAYAFKDGVGGIGGTSGSGNAGGAHTCTVGNGGSGGAGNAAAVSAYNPGSASGQSGTAGTANSFTGTSYTYSSGGTGGNGGSISAGTNGATATIIGAGGTGGTGGNGATGVAGGTGGRGGPGMVALKYTTPSDSASVGIITANITSFGDASTSGAITLNIPELVPVGRYYETLTITDSLGLETSTVVTIIVSKDTPDLTLSLPLNATTAKYGTAVVISAKSSSEGTFNFKDGGTSMQNQLRLEPLPVGGFQVRLQRTH